MKGRSISQRRVRTPVRRSRVKRAALIGVALKARKARVTRRRRAAGAAMIEAQVKGTKPPRKLRARSR